MARMLETGRVAVVAQTVGPADIVEQERLKLVAGDMVVRVVRVGIKGDLPASYARTVLPLTRFPGLTPESDIGDDTVALADANGVALGRVTETVDTTYATAEVATYLGIDPDEAVLRVERIVRCMRGLPIEWRVTFAAP